MSDTKLKRRRNEKLFFKSFEHLLADIRIVRAKDEYLSPSPGAGRHLRRKAWFRLIVQTCLSVVLMAGGFYMLLSGRFDENTKKIGSGFIGTAIGYWLR